MKAELLCLPTWLQSPPQPGRMRSKGCRGANTEHEAAVIASPRCRGLRTTWGPSNPCPAAHRACTPPQPSPPRPTARKPGPITLPVPTQHPPPRTCTHPPPSTSTSQQQDTPPPNPPAPSTPLPIPMAGVNAPAGCTGQRSQGRGSSVSPRWVPHFWAPSEVLGCWQGRGVGRELVPAAPGGFM